MQYKHYIITGKEKGREIANRLIFEKKKKKKERKKEEEKKKRKKRGQCHCQC